MNYETPKNYLDQEQNSSKFQELYGHYDKKLKESLETLKEVKNDYVWKKVKKKECQSYCAKLEGSSFRIFKGESVCYVDPLLSSLELATVTAELPYFYERNKKLKEEVDPQVVYYRKIHEVKDKERRCVVQGRFCTGFMFVSDRETMWIRDVKSDESKDNCVHYGCSITKNKEKLLDCHFTDANKEFSLGSAVRGHLNFFSYFFERMKDLDSNWKNKDEKRKCYKLTYILHADPKGMIPASLYNLGMYKQVFGSGRLCRFLEDTDRVKKIFPGFFKKG